MSMPVHPRLRMWLDIGGDLFELGEKLVDEARKHTRKRRSASYATVRPGPATPLWNLLAGQLKSELRQVGAKVRLARYLGVPKQRLTDFLTGGRRMPDAELTLRMLYWLAEKRAGRDLSL